MVYFSLAFKVLYNFFKKQWHEIPSSEQSEQLVNMVMDYLDLESLPVPTEKRRHPPVLEIRGLKWRAGGVASK